MEKKSVFKEIIIALLLCLTILLVLSLVLYEYVPSRKTLPEKISYVTPEEVSEELVANAGVDEKEIVMTYEVEPEDMSKYERANDYNPGKANPFQTLKSEKEIAKEAEKAAASGNISGAPGDAGSTSSGTAASGASASTDGTSTSGSSTERSSLGGTSSSTSSSSEFYNDHGSGK